MIFKTWLRAVLQIGSLVFLALSSVHMVALIARYGEQMAESSLIFIAVFNAAAGVLFGVLLSDIIRRKKLF